MTNEQIKRELRARGIGSGEFAVAMKVREGRMPYESNRETVDMVEIAVAEIIEDDEAGVL